MTVEQKETEPKMNINEDYHIIYKAIKIITPEYKIQAHQSEQQ